MCKANESRLASIQPTCMHMFAMSILLGEEGKGNSGAIKGTSACLFLPNPEDHVSISDLMYDDTPGAIVISCNRDGCSPTMACSKMMDRNSLAHAPCTISLSGSCTTNRNR